MIHKFSHHGSQKKKIGDGVCGFRSCQCGGGYGDGFLGVEIISPQAAIYCSNELPHEVVELAKIAECDDLILIPAVAP